MFRCFFPWNVGGVLLVFFSPSNPSHPRLTSSSFPQHHRAQFHGGPGLQCLLGCQILYCLGWFFQDAGVTKHLKPRHFSALVVLYLEVFTSSKTSQNHPKPPGFQEVSFVCCYISGDLPPDLPWLTKEVPLLKGLNDPSGFVRTPKIQPKKTN